MTTHLPITPLTPSLKRLGEHLVAGRTAHDIAAVEGLSPQTVKKYLSVLRETLRCPSRCAPPVLLHYLLTSRQVEAPSVDRPAPDLAPTQRALLSAVAEHSKRDAIACAAGIAPADLRPHLAALLADADAHDTGQLVVQAHAWGMLAADQSAGAGR